MPSPFQISAPLLRANGYSVVPLAPRAKNPIPEEWQKFGVKPADEETFQRWMKWSANNVGVCLGVASNLVAVDYDHDVDGLHEKIKSMLPESPIAKMGEKGETRFYQFNGQKSVGYSKSGKRVIDILSQGRQTVVPPSIHPSGKTYRWLTEKTLENTPATELPHISLQTIYDIGAIFKPEPYVPAKQDFPILYDDANEEQVAQALSFIPPDDYEMWIRIGMSLKDELGHSGFRLWDNWSSKSEKYNAREMQAKWNSFNGTGITIGSLFHLGMDHGYVWAPPKSDPIEDFVLNGQKTGRIEVAVAQPQDDLKETDKLIFPSHLLNAPGLPGLLAEFIGKTSLMPQPILALGAAICGAGTLMARKVRSDTNLRTNFYILGLSMSGAGKDHARTVIKRIYHDTGMENLELAPPKSSAGLISQLRDRGSGRGLVLWDEFGRVLAQLSHWKAGTHERDIITAMMELFTSAHSVYMGGGYANHDGKNPVKPIDQPCLSIYGTSVPGRFYNALSNAEAMDGFLSRWLVFESKDYTMEEEEPQEDLANIPERIINVAKFWKEQSFNSAPEGNLGDAIKCSPKLIKADKAAHEYMKAFATDMRKKAVTAEMSGDPTGAIWSRAGEHARKLALVAHVEDGIDLKTAEWACALSDFCSHYMAGAIQDFVSSSELESTTKKILKWIKDRTKTADAWVNKSEITRAFQGVSTRVRGEVISSLAERGEVLVEKQASPSGPPSFRYRFNR